MAIANIIGIFVVRFFVATRIARCLDGLDFQKLALRWPTGHFAKIDAKIVVACWTPTDHRFG